MRQRKENKLNQHSAFYPVDEDKGICRHQDQNIDNHKMRVPGKPSRLRDEFSTDYFLYNFHNISIYTVS
jgi:hypothetical protein